jgi:hypothetical protein
MEKGVTIRIDSLTNNTKPKEKSLPGSLALPEKARALVIFAHGSGSSRFSPRNRLVAGILQQAGFGTLLFDLLTPEEDQLRVGTLRRKPSGVLLRPEAVIYSDGQAGPDRGPMASRIETSREDQEGIDGAAAVS